MIQIPAAYLVEIHDSQITVEHGMDIVAGYGVQIRGSTMSASQASIRATMEDIQLDGCGSSNPIWVRVSVCVTLVLELELRIMASVGTRVKGQG